MSATRSLNVFSVGGSRNIGYYTAIRLLDAGATVTFLLRTPNTFDSDETIQPYVKQGKAQLVKGDALVREEVQNAWNRASANGHVDLLLFTVGGVPKISLLYGAVISPHNLVTQSLLNVLSTMPDVSNSPEQTRVVVLSSTGLTGTSHSNLPTLLKPIYSWLLKQPHKDKFGTERVVFHCAGWPWDPQADGEPDADVMGENWMEREGLPKPGSLRHCLVLRPALLTDGECVADKPPKEGQQAKEPYRVSDKDFAGWTVSRKDTAHFLANTILNNWDKYDNKIINIAY
ncbi:hypothetical protein D9611_008255 [Ephemerocybe angulata]|uniref:NAD(P)-binding domain-containing protein n=1 Tax=Ephemerocybe angulata TaxID=980116 RepID=A0A8H5BIQ4_9AGAR|nr:hypothetical protein D9611_008255 [Tulosesus angulatus]